ncbi:MAG: hypothetical protein AB7K68_13710 [Bacteriovoracia bacterium]
MPRITLVAVLALLILSVPAMAKTETCGKRVQAFNEYEELVEGKLVTKVSIFDMGEWSPDAGFEGLLVKAGEDPKVKLEISATKGKKAQSTKKKDWATAAQSWKDNKNYRLVENFDKGRDVFGEKYEDGTFVVRLTLNGKVLCEDSARKMVAGD